MKVFLGMGGAVNANVKSHLEKTASDRWAESQFESFKKLVNLGKKPQTVDESFRLSKTQMGSGYVTPPQRQHFAKHQAQQWINQPLADFAQEIETVGFGQSAISPAVLSHVQKQKHAKQSINDHALEHVGFGQSAISPQVIRHLQACGR